MPSSLFCFPVFLVVRMVLVCDCSSSAKVSFAVHCLYVKKAKSGYRFLLIALPLLISTAYRRSSPPCYFR
jgi:hypothetical protein